MNQFWYQLPNGSNVGPVPAKTLIILCEKRVIVDETLVRQGRDGRWAQACRYPKLKQVIDQHKVYPPESVFEPETAPQVQPPEPRRLVVEHVVPQVVTIQKTAKKWKALELIGVCLIAVGIVGCMATIEAAREESIEYPDLFSFLAIGGILMWICARFAAWWDHG